jgi:hypothetical protein
LFHANLSSQKNNLSRSTVTSVWCLRSSFNQSRAQSAKPTLTRIQRLARDRMSLASLAGSCAVVWWLMIASMVVAVSARRSLHPFSAQLVLEHWNLMPKQPANGWLLARICMMAFVTMMAPIVCLRRLGNALYTQPPLSIVVARRFQ